MSEEVEQWRFFPGTKDELRGLDEGKGPMAALMKSVQRGEPTLPRETEPLGDGLHALRVSLAHDEFRCIYMKTGRFSQILVALRFFKKKTERIPSRDLKIAKRRRGDWFRASPG